MNFVYNKYEGNSSDTERYRQTDSRIVRRTHRVRLRQTEPQGKSEADGHQGTYQTDGRP